MTIYGNMTTHACLELVTSQHDVTTLHMLTIKFSSHKNFR